MDNGPPPRLGLDSSTPTSSASDDTEHSQSVPRSDSITPQPPPSESTEAPQARCPSNSARWISNTLFPPIVRAGWSRIFIIICNLLTSIPRIHLAAALAFIVMSIGAAYEDPQSAPSWQEVRNWIIFFLLYGLFSAMVFVCVEYQAMTMRRREEWIEWLQDYWLSWGNAGVAEAGQELARMHGEIDVMLATRDRIQDADAAETDVEGTDVDARDENAMPYRIAYRYDTTFQHFPSSLSPSYQGRDDAVQDVYEVTANEQNEQDGNVSVAVDDDEHSEEFPTLPLHAAPNSPDDCQNDPIQDADDQSTHEEDLSLNSPANAEDSVHGPTSPYPRNDPNDPLIFLENQDEPPEDTYDAYTHAEDLITNMQDPNDDVLIILTDEDINKHTPVPYDEDAEIDTMLSKDDGDKDSVNGSRLRDGTRVGDGDGDGDERDGALQEWLQGTTSDPPPDDVVHRSGLLGDSP